MAARRPAATLRLRQNDLDGMLMMNWERVCVGDVAVMKRGKYVTQKDTRLGNIPVILGGQEPAYYCDESNHDGPCVVISRSGASAGFVSYWDEPIFVTDGFLFEANERCDIRFLYYCLKSNQSVLGGMQNGSGIPHVQGTALKEFPISLPPLPEQRKIANELTAIDRKIALNRKRIATLEAMAKEIYDYWFVQFDFPDAHGHPYKSSGGAMVYNPDLKREIPKEWEVVKLSRMADFLFGYPFDSSRFNSNGEGRRIVRIRNVKDGYSNDFTTEDAPSEYIIRNGDLLIGMDGYFDMNIWVGGDAYLVQRSCRVKAKDSIYQGYVRRFIAPPIKQLEKTLLGATVAHLGKTHLDDIDIIVPPKDVRAFQMLNDLDASIVQQGLEAAKLSALRDFLLPVLMNGQVKVG